MENSYLHFALPTNAMKRFATLLFALAVCLTFTTTATAQTTPPGCPNVHDSNGNNTIDI